MPVVLLNFDQADGAVAFGVAWTFIWLLAYASGAWAYLTQPHNLAARRLLAFGALTLVFQPLSFLLVGLYLDHGASTGVAALNFALTILFPLSAVALLGALATYPDGIYQRRIERVMVRGAVVAAVLLPLVALVVGPDIVLAQAFLWQADSLGSLGMPSFAGPLEVGALSWLSSVADGYGEGALGVCAGLGALALGLRFRRFKDRPKRRLQIRWVAYAGLVCLLAPILFAFEAVGAITPFTRDIIGLAILAFVPASLAIGIARPDLFDVDRAFRRSLTYLLLWAAVGALYAAVAAALGIAVGGESIQVAVAVAILATAALEPVRRHIADRIGRALFGSVVSSEELVRRLGATLASTMDLDELARQIAETAREGLNANWVRVEVNGHFAVTAGTPGDGEPAGELLEEELARNDSSVGRIVCSPGVRSPIRGDDREVLRTLARQGALAIHNAQLAGELERSLEEIRLQTDELVASRARIVAAEEQARRQIERDIHDGVQQELVALVARMGVARSQLGRNPEHAAKTLAELQGEASQTIEHLRDLAAGIHPSVLTDHGVVQAIEERAARLPVGVTIELEPQMRARRFPEAVEGAAYFFVGECLTNAVKHAGCERATVRFELEGDDALRVEVSDPGRGFDVAQTELRGLAGLRDRIEALGGVVWIKSSEGDGTRISAQLPALAHADV